MNQQDEGRIDPFDSPRDFDPTALTGDERAFEFGDLEMPGDDPLDDNPVALPDASYEETFHGIPLVSSLSPPASCRPAVRGTYEENVKAAVDNAAAELGISPAEYLDRLSGGDWDDDDDTGLDEPYDFDGNPAPPEVDEAAQRKDQPIFSGVMNYFPDALLAVAETSRIGNEQHNPGEPLHWAKGKSADHPDALARHLLDHGTLDTDGQRHSAKVAWRALALLQTEIENERTLPSDPINPAEYRIEVSLPVSDEGGTVYEFTEVDLNLHILDYGHGMALAHDLSGNTYPGLKVIFFRGDEELFSLRVPSEIPNPVAGGSPGS